MAHSHNDDDATRCDRKCELHFEHSVARYRKIDLLIYIHFWKQFITNENKIDSNANKYYYCRYLSINAIELYFWIALTINGLPNAVVSSLKWCIFGVPFTRRLMAEIIDHFDFDSLFMMGLSVVVSLCRSIALRSFASRCDRHKYARS